MNLDYDFVQMWKFSEDQKKKNANGTLFSPNSGEDQKKNYSSKIKHFFPNFRSDVHQFKLLEGIHPNYWGEYIPPSLLVMEPLCVMLAL